MSEPVRIQYNALVAGVLRALVSAGMPEALARQEAEILAEADLFGVPSHGVRMLPGLLSALKEGRAKAQPDIRIIHQFGATAVIDADNGPGRSASCQAMQEAVERARQFGIGACLAIHTTHWGRAHAYAYRAAKQGMIGLCTTNAMPTMAGWGAKQKVIGNNPLAIGIPRSEREAPLVLDIAMSQAAVGKVATWQREHREVPPGWGLDASGAPTTDPAAILAGAVLPFGGHKGAGLALIMELMTAALAGSAFGNEIFAGDRSGLDPDSSKLFIALNPEAFGGASVLTGRVDDYLTYLKQNASETQAFYWPGERGWQDQQRNLKEGVPLHPDIVSQIKAVGVVFS